MKIVPDFEIDLQQTFDDGRYDALAIVSFGMIALSAVVIMMTVSIMVS